MWVVSGFMQRTVFQWSTNMRRAIRMSRRLWKFTNYNWAPRSAVFTARHLAFRIFVFINFNSNLIYYCVCPETSTYQWLFQINLKKAIKSDVHWRTLSRSRAASSVSRPRGLFVSYHAFSVPRVDGLKMPSLFSLSQHEVRHEKSNETNI